MASRPGPFKYAPQVFFAISGLALVAIVLLARPVLLPFMLAVLVAYVLFPAVRRVERLRVPRWVAILLVYIVTIGAVAGFSTAVVPRLFEETKLLSAELPGLTKRIRNDWLPQLDARLRRIVPSAPKPAATGKAPAPPSSAAGDAAAGDSTAPGTTAGDSAAGDSTALGAASGSAAPAPPPAAKPPAPPAPTDQAPVVITPRQDGAYEVRLREDLEFHKESDSTWTLRSPHAKPGSGFSSERALRDAFDKAIAYAQKNSLELLKVGRQVVGGISRGIFYFFITLMLAGYLMFTYEDIHKFIREMWPEHRRPAFDRFLNRLDQGLSGVVRGQLLICLVNGVLSAIGFWIFDLKYWPILALIAGVMSIIPIFGSILSTIPAVAIGLTQGFGTALGVLLWVVGIHQLEANFLNPKIIGDSAKIHPVLVVFALLFGEHFYQITGALLAVPVLSLAQTVFLHFRESILGLPASTRRSEELVARGKIPTNPPKPEDDDPRAVEAADGPETPLATGQRRQSKPPYSGEGNTMESPGNYGDRARDNKRDKGAPGDGDTEPQAAP